MQGATATLENSPAGNRAQPEVLRRTYLQQQAIGQIAEGVNQEIAAGRIPPGQFRAVSIRRWMLMPKTIRCSRPSSGKIRSCSAR